MEKYFYDISQSAAPSKHHKSYGKSFKKFSGGTTEQRAILKKVWSSRIFCRRTYKYRISYKSFHFRCNSIKDLNFRIHSFTACFKLINNQISLSFKNILTSFSSSISFLLLLYWDGLTNLAKVIIVTPLSVLDPSASAGVDAAWSFLLVMGIIMAS